MRRKLEAGRRADDGEGAEGSAHVLEGSGNTLRRSGGGAHVCLRG